MPDNKAYLAMTAVELGLLMDILTRIDNRISKSTRRLLFEADREAVFQLLSETITTAVATYTVKAMHNIKTS
jgi:hypothetical protein